MVLVCSVQFTVKDDKGRHGHIQYYADLDDPTWVIPSDDRIGNLVAYFQEVAIRSSNMLYGAITDIHVSLNVPVPEYLLYDPSGLADVEEIATCKFAPPPGVRFQHSVPAFYHPAFENAGRTDLPYPYDDWPDAGLKDYVDLLISPATAANWADDYGGITDQRGEAVTAQPTFYKGFRRRER